MANYPTSEQTEYVSPEEKKSRQEALDQKYADNAQRVYRESHRPESREEYLAKAREKLEAQFAEIEKEYDSKFAVDRYASGGDRPGAAAPIPGYPGLQVTHDADGYTESDDSLDGEDGYVVKKGQSRQEMDYPVSWQAPPSFAENPRKATRRAVEEALAEQEQ
jgi:hypothetical protein